MQRGELQRECGLPQLLQTLRPLQLAEGMAKNEQHVRHVPTTMHLPTPPLPVIANAHILQRLRHLLESGELQRELDHVGYHSIHFDNVYGSYRYEMDIYGFAIE